MYHNAAKQFMADCGSSQVARVAKELLISDKTITIDDSIVWCIMSYGICVRTDSIAHMYAIYHNNGDSIVWLLYGEESIEEEYIEDTPMEIDWEEELDNWFANKGEMK